MAGGWARDDAVNDQIDVSTQEAIERMQLRNAGAGLRESAGFATNAMNRSPRRGARPFRGAALRGLPVRARQGLATGGGYQPARIEGFAAALDYQRRTADPQARPPPMASATKTRPGVMRPCELATDSASGIEAAEVFAVIGDGQHDLPSAGACVWRWPR